MTTHAEVPLEFETVEEVLGASLDKRRFMMLMVGIFADAALALAMIGLYGVMAYITGQRTAEFGIRMALGAQRADVLRLILRQSLVLVAVGVTVGVVAATGATCLLKALLYGVGKNDPFTYAAVIILLALAALAASYFPAHRASRVDPMIALRYE